MEMVINPIKAMIVMKETGLPRSIYVCKNEMMIFATVATIIKKPKPMTIRKDIRRLFIKASVACFLAGGTSQIVLRAYCSWKNSIEAAKIKAM